MSDVTGFSDLHVLNSDNIKQHVPKSPGCYVLDRSTTGGFDVYYTGRADYDLEERLLSYANGKYKYFRYLSLASRKDAFEMECKVYHNLKPIDNIIHPDAPDGTSYTCPIAGCSKRR